MRMLAIFGIVVLIGLTVTVIINQHYFVANGAQPWVKTARWAVISWWALLAIWSVYSPKLEGMMTKRKEDES